MMNNNKKITALIIWILLISTVITSCRSAIPGETTESLGLADSYIGESNGFSTESVTGPAVESTTEKERLNSDTILKYTLSFTPASADSVACTVMLNKKIRDGIGASLQTSGNKTIDAEYKIIIGDAASAKEASLGYDDFRILATENNIYIDGGSKYALFNAADKLYNNIIGNTLYEELNYTYTAPGREQYINDCTDLVMHWNYALTVPDWMVSWDGKLSRLCDASDNHVFTISHRGDFTYYPENSIESYISVYKMGGDAVEIDVQVTSDGQLILMHDSTLERMTDYLSYAGKTVDGIKFPNSANVRDWTLEELSYLHLKEGAGGSGAAITPYMIPTLEETLTFCKNRLFIVLDKPENWRYVKLDSIMVNSAANYIYPLMEKTNNYTSVLISYGTLNTDAARTLSANQALEIQKYIMDNSGQKCYMYLRGWTTRSTADPYANTFEKGSLTNSAILVNGEFDSGNPTKIAAIKALAAKYKNTKFGGWTLTDTSDNATVWKLMYDTGIRVIMSNDIVSLIKFAAEIK